MAMIKWVTRVITILAIVFSVVVGFATVNNYRRDTTLEDLGIRMLRLLYEYDSIDEVYSRTETLQSLCSSEVWDELSLDNTEHFRGTWGRTKNYSTKVRVVFIRPGLIVYALENINVTPTDLWCFEYRAENGKLVSVLEYKLVSMRRDLNGGLF